MHQHATRTAFSSSESWVILSPIEESIRRKIEAVGTPLKEWDIQINYGIKTGYNDAFIISTQKRDEILAACQTEDERQRTEAVIRPILRGKDIKRYGYDWAGLWLIYIPWHFPLQFDETIQGASEQAEAAFMEQYPSVYAHMLQYKEPLSKRNKSETGIRYEWYAMQRWGANYWEDFDKPHICWKAVGRNLAFALVEGGIYLTAPASFISADANNEYILACLCSDLCKYFIYKSSDTTGAGDIMLNIKSLVTLPLPIKFDRMYVREMLNDPDRDNLINKYMRQLYGFNSDEWEYIQKYKY